MTKFQSKINSQIYPANIYIDNLFINPDGYVKLVETKLWRNAEARCEVIGQLLDYVKELTKLTFGNLDKKVRKINKLLSGKKDK